MSHWLSSRTTRSKKEEMNMGIDLRHDRVGDCRSHVSITLSSTAKNVERTIKVEIKSFNRYINPKNRSEYA